MSTPAADQATPRLVVVTGGNSGIGAACVAHFRSAGDSVVIADRSTRDFPVDVTDPVSVDHFFSRLPRPPDVLVNAAGIDDGGSTLHFTFDDWRKVIDVNLHGSFLCLQAAAH